MEGCITDIRKTLVDKLLDKAIEKSRYLFCFTRIVKEFNEEKDKLEAERATMRQYFEVATKKGKDIQSNAEFWEKQADGLIQENTETKQRCFLGFCPNCIRRYKRGEELATKTKVIKDLIEKAEKFENIEITHCLPGVERHSSQYYIPFESRELKYKELMDALKDDSNYMVGLHGMGGAGKTTLAKEVGKQLKTQEHFKYVIDTTVSFNLDIKKIQNDIAGSLGLEWGHINESDRPKRLWSRLTKGDKILVILDDVWENINFADIGLPNSDNHNGCKVLVTTRNLWVCNKMGCGKTIQLELLTEEDAWNMFKMYADLSNISSKIILGKGRKIATECKRLPVAIATIASSLKGQKSREEWDVVLNCLQNHVSMGNVDDDLVDIFKCLKFSYDYLKDEKAKGLFLLCSAFPEDQEISVELLTRLGIGVNLFGEGFDKYNDARSQAIVAKHKLLNSCLLLETEEGDVKMHDLVREVAQWIANKEILAVNLFEKNQKSLVEGSKNIKCLFFQGKLMDLFSSRFDGSKLEILIAYTSMDDLEDVPTSLFENMVGLRVLNLKNSFTQKYRRYRLSLPKSIQLLMNIRSLLIEYFNLGDISVLGTLQSLETLELHSCTIDEFPPEIAMLNKLRLLSLRWCEIRSNNPFEVIQRCQSLEELYFCDSFNIFYQEITLPTLERYLLIDDFSDWNGSQSKGVALEGDHLSEATYKYVMKTSCYLHLIRIKGWKNLMPAMVPIVEGMNDLIELRLGEISQLQCLVDTKHVNSQEPIVFSKLVVLELKRMEALEELCNGPISVDFMNNLEELYIEECENLRSLFKCRLNLSNLKTVKLEKCSRLVSVFELSTSQSLPRLEKLEIFDCEKLENIIAFERRAMGEECHPLFPNLKDLHIEECHQLQFILPILSASDLVSLEDITIRCCHKLEYIFGQHQDVKLTSLQEVVINGMPNFIDIFPPNASSISKPMDDTIEELADGYDDNKSCYSLFPKLKILWINKCHKLKYIFGQHQDAKFPSLKLFRIDDLPNFIDIFPPNASSISKDGSKPQTQQGPIKGNTFSMCCYRYKLKSTKTPMDFEKSNSYCLDIWEPAQCLLRQSHILCNTTQIGILNFPKIKSVFILSNAPRVLKYLTIEKCEELKQIIIDSTGGNNFGNVFPKLKGLDVKDCVQLEYIFEPYNLNHQNQTECPQLASGDFIKELSGNEENGHQMNLSLESITLIDLPMMRCLFVGLKYSFVLNNLTEMKIVRCEKLEIVFSTSVLRCLPQLVRLEVKECKELKHIIEDDLKDKISQSSNTFFPKLETVLLTKCDKLKYVFPVSICKYAFTQLVRLEVEECKELKHIIEDDLEDKISQSSNTFFPKLETVLLTKCDKLKYVFPVSICKEFPKLKAMFIREANDLEEIFKSDKKDEVEEISKTEVEIPNLKWVGFANLPSLCHAQRVHFQTVKYRFVHSCQKLSLTSCNEDARPSVSWEDRCWRKNFFVMDPDYYLRYRFEEIRRECDKAVSEHKLTSPQLNDEEAALTFSETDSDYDNGNDDELEGSTSEITAAATVSTITETKNKPPAQEVDSKQKGIEINVEEGTASANAKTITSSTHLDAVGSSSGQLVTSECKTSSHEGGDSQIAMTSFSVSTTETNDQGFLNHDSFKKVSSNIEEQFPKDDDIIVSKSKPSPSITSPVVYQFPPVPCKDGKLFGELQEELFKGDNGGDENPSAETTIDFAAGSEVQEALEHQWTSPQELMNEKLMDQQSLMNQQQTLAETDITIKPSQEENGIQIYVKEETPSANAKTITSSTHLDVAGSSSGQLVASECKTSSQEDGDTDSQIAMTSFSISTKETIDQGCSGSLNHDSFKKVSSNIEEQFPKDDDITVSKSKPSPSITSPVVSQFPPVSSKEDPSQKVQDLSSSSLVKSELEQLVSKNYLDWRNFYLLNDFFVKHPSVRLKDTSLSNRYKGCAYNLLAELLKFLETHNVLEVLGSFHSEFLELLQDAHSFGFDKDWLDGVERRALFPDIQVSQDALQKLLDSKQQVTKDVEVLRLKIGILSQQLTSSEAVLESIIQQEVVLSAPIGY